MPGLRAIVVALCCVCATASAQPSSQAPTPSPPKPTGVVTKSPKLIQAQAPEYPPAALQAGKEAKVKVRIHIAETGVVTAVDVAVPVGDGFDEAAQAAAMQYIFEPAEIDGKPGKITVETTINFVSGVSADLIAAKSIENVSGVRLKRFIVAPISSTASTINS